MDISIVLPVWNESAKILADLDAAFNFFETYKLLGEVIVSDDGSTDESIRVVETRIAAKKFPLRIIKNKHFGKGNAVKAGILQAEGGIVLFIDSGNCIPYSDVRKGIQLIKNGECDISIASRYLSDSMILVPKAWGRRLLSYLFRKFVQVYMGIPRHLTDTQCGLKIYKKEVAKRLYRQCFTKGFIFDIEIILRANQEDIKIKEFSVRWSSDPDSRLSIVQSFPKILKELLWIKRKLTTSA